MAPLANRRNTQPLIVPRTVRTHATRAMTSLPAGRMVPLAAIPLLREDAVRSGQVTSAFEMMETAEILMNSVNVRVMAYLVPDLVYPRFNGSMDTLNKSFKGEPDKPGGTVVDYFSVAELGAAKDIPIHRYLGVHHRAGQLVNRAYITAYNAIWNHRAAMRTSDLPARNMSDATLAPAFWLHEQLAHVVPDFDQAAMEGAVPLALLEGSVADKFVAVEPNQGNREPTFQGRFGAGQISTQGRMMSAASTGEMYTEMSSAAPRALSWLDPKLRVNIADVINEISDQGIMVTLANIDLARKTQAFAALRRQFEGHFKPGVGQMEQDDFLIDMLMDGLTIPDQYLKQPILLGEARTIFGQTKRYATDAEDLTASATNGLARIDMRYRVPRLPMGGMVMIVAEITPDPLYERMQDPIAHMTMQPHADNSYYPAYLRDTLDPQKVEIVENQYVDIDHDNPTDTFGYAPLNHRWNRNVATIGGKFFRPEVDAGFDEDRQRFWAVETKNPTLAEDFYLTTKIHTKPFLVTNQDPFEAVTIGIATIEGNTVFGANVVEATDSYEKVMEKAPTERIDQTE